LQEKGFLTGKDNRKGKIICAAVKPEEGYVYPYFYRGRIKALQGYARKGMIMRVKVTLECTESHDRNYTITKNKQKHPERMEIMKYCPRLKKYTLHKETK